MIVAKCPVFLISIRAMGQEFFLISIGSMHQNQHGAVCDWWWRCRGRVAWVVPWSAVAHLASASLTCVRSGLTSFHLTSPLATGGAATLQVVLGIASPRQAEIPGFWTCRSEVQKLLAFAPATSHCCVVFAWALGNGTFLCLAERVEYVLI